MVKYLHKLFGKFLHGRFVYSSPFIYISMDSWILLLYTLGYNSRLPYSFSCSNCSSFDFWELFQLTTGSFWRMPIIAIITIFSIYYFLSLQDDAGLSGVIPIPVQVFLGWEINDCFEGPWFLLLESSIWIQGLDATYAHCYWSIIATRPSQLTKQGSTSVYTNPCMHTNSSTPTCISI